MPMKCKVLNVKEYVKVKEPAAREGEKKENTGIYS